jgi:hypothetical protein
MRLTIRLLAPLVLLLAMLLPAGSATAAPANPTASERFELFTGIFNTCNGESVAVEGTYHNVSKVLKDGTRTFHFNLNAEGVGDQGNEYVFNWNGKGSFSTTEFSVSQRNMAISKGSAPNQAVTVHIDADGSFSIDTDCNG